MADLKLWLEGEGQPQASAPHGRKIMRLHMVRPRPQPYGGTRGGGNRGAPAPVPAPVMDPAVWSRLPEDIMWKVVERAPAAKRFQFQLVSGRWRRHLTSPAFRKAVAARQRERGGGGGSREPSMIACVPSIFDRDCLFTVSATGTACAGGERRSSPRRVDMNFDLRFVPREFWPTGSTDLEWCDVAAAAEGLVCIVHLRKDEGEEPVNVGWCVFNPLTRDCTTVLPALPVTARPPWPHAYAVHLRSGSLTVLVTWVDTDIHDSHQCHWVQATCDLTAAAAARAAGAVAAASGWTVCVTTRGPACLDLASLRLGQYVHRQEYSHRQHLIWCDGKTWSYVVERLRSRLLVHAVADGRVVQVAASPPPDTLKVEYVCMVEHRGRAFLFAASRKEDPEEPARAAAAHVTCRVWRLEVSGDRVTWHQVAVLSRRTLDAFTGSRYTHCRGVSVARACPMGDLLGVQLIMYRYLPTYDMYLRTGKVPRLERTHLMLGLNPETGAWELLFHDDSLIFTKPFQLQPNSYLL